MKQKVELVSLGLTENEAERVMTLESEMLDRAVRFQFRKKDGSIRDAEGTLNPDLMVLEDGTKWEPKGEAKPAPANNLRFFDVIAHGWRSFIVTNLIAVEV